MSQSLSERVTDLQKLFDDRYGAVLRGRLASEGSRALLWLCTEAETEADKLDALGAEAGAAAEGGLGLVPPFAGVFEAEEGIAATWKLAGFQPLRALIAQKGSLPLSQSLDVIHQVAEGLAGIPAEVLHHDISPSTLWVAPAGSSYTVRLLGHGLRAVFPRYRTGFRGPLFWGTPEYMSPELCSGKPADARADLYSLGIVLLEMLTAKPPFASANPRTTMKRQIYEKPLPLRLAKPGLTGVNDLDTLLSHLLAKMAVKRTPDAQALLSALETFRSAHLSDLAWSAVGTPPDVVEEGPATEPASMEVFDNVPKAAKENVQGAKRGTLVFGGLELTQTLKRAAAAKAAEEDAEEAAAAAAPSPSPEPGGEGPAAEEVPAPEEPEVATADRPTKVMPTAKVGTVPDAGGGEPSEDLSDWYVDGSEALPSDGEADFAYRVRKSNRSATLLFVIIAVVLAVVAFFVFRPKDTSAPTPRRPRTAHPVAPPRPATRPAPKPAPRPAVVPAVAATPDTGPKAAPDAGQAAADPGAPTAPDTGTASEQQADVAPEAPAPAPPVEAKPKPAPPVEAKPKPAPPVEAKPKPAVKPKPRPVRKPRPKPRPKPAARPSPKPAARPEPAPPVDPAAAYKSAMREGFAAYKSGSYPAALKAFKRAQKAKPNDLMAGAWIKKVMGKMAK